MTYIEIFSGDINSVQKQINRWLSFNETVEITHLKQTALSANGEYSHILITIAYTEAEILK